MTTTYLAHAIHEHMDTTPCSVVLYISPTVLRVAIDGVLPNNRVHKVLEFDTWYP
jgi:hypothetical protein